MTNNIINIKLKIQNNTKLFKRDECKRKLPFLNSIHVHLVCKTLLYYQQKKGS